VSGVSHRRVAREERHSQPDGVMSRVTRAVLGCLLLAACTSPTAHLYTLMASEPAAVAAPSNGEYKVVIAHVTLPESVDRPELVIRAGPNRVSALEQERWVEPLHEAIPRAIREDVSTQLPGVTVLLDGEVADAKPDLVLDLEIVRFELFPGERAVIEARGWLKSRTGSSRLVHSVARGQVHGSRDDYNALVAATAAALSSLSADLARAIEAARQTTP
jgi:uncharacterized lipoprotein YmbA